MKKYNSIIFGCLFLIFSVVPIWAMILQEKRVQLTLEHVNLEQGLDRIADLYGFKVEINGNIPKRKFSIQLQELEFEKAIQVLMKSAGANNTAISYDLQNNTVKIWVLGSDLSLNITTTQSFQSLTPEQIEQLEPDDLENYEPLTLAQIQQLEPQSLGDYEPLTPEQIEELEPDYDGDFEPLTPEQIKQLKSDDYQSDYEPLTPEQIRKLELDNTFDQEPLSPEQIQQLEPVFK